MRNEKAKQAKKIIPGLTVMAQKKDLHRNKYGLAWQYYFSIATNKGRYAAIFTDSINNHDNNIPVNLDDILYSWIVDADSFNYTKDFDDFCLEFGYDFKQYDEYDSKYRLGKQQAETIKKNASMRGDMKNINICLNKPRYNSNRYIVSYKNFDELGAIWKK